MASFCSFVFLVAPVLALSPLSVCIDGSEGAICVDGKQLPLRGSNYIRLDSYHSTFEPHSYNRTRYNEAFALMQHDGYNIVRVFIDGRPNQGIGGNASSTVPFDDLYVNRMIEFINDAAQHGLYTIVTLANLPGNAYFEKFYSGVPRIAQGKNLDYLQKEWHDAWESYTFHLAAALKRGLSPVALNAVVLSLQNELNMLSTLLPFSNTSASVTCADGRAYAMNDAVQRQQAMDSNVNLWVARGRSAWQTSLPQSLVTVGIFSFHAVNKAGPNGLICTTKDCRFPARPYWLSRSEVDFLDVHIYQANGTLPALDENLHSMEWAKLNTSKPIIMGEFGCLGGRLGPNRWYSSARECAPHVKDLQVSSCSRSFKGWLFWTYDTDTDEEQPQWYDMMDDDGAINKILSPLRFPDACTRPATLV